LDRQAYPLWFGRTSVCVAAFGLALAILSPPEGVGLALCFFHDATGLPCPGCGLARSLSCAMRGLFLESWRYHPMGLLILALFLLTVSQRLLPGVLRKALAKEMNARRALFITSYLLFVGTFTVFGLIRVVVALGARLLFI
jgi:hypothetical protein